MKCSCNKSLFARLWGLISWRTGKNKLEADSRPSTLQINTSNGFVIESLANWGLDDAGDLVYAYSVRGLSGKAQWCHVFLKKTLAAEIDSYAGADRHCERSRFLLAVCEKALSSYLLQHERLPDDGFLEVDSLTKIMRQWIDAVLSRPAGSPALLLERPTPVADDV